MQYCQHMLCAVRYIRRPSLWIVTVMERVATVSHTVIHDITRHHQKFAAKHVHFITSVHRPSGKLLYSVYRAVADEQYTHALAHTHTHTRLTALCPGLPWWLKAPQRGWAPTQWLPGWAGTRKVKPMWILLKQETVSGNSISWAVCKSAPRSRQITMPAPHHSVFYRLYALPATQPTAQSTEGWWTVLSLFCVVL